MRKPWRGYRFQVSSLLALLGSAGLSGPALAGFPGTDVFIPASARAAGAAPSQFYSTLWLTNLSTTDTANVQLKFFQRDTSNTSPVTAPVTVAPGETKKYENVVQTVFALPSASGAIRVVSDQIVLASSRTYNLPPGADIRDANGLFFTGIPQTFAIGPGESSQLQGVSQGGAEDFRYNFGIVETAGSPVTVRVTVRGSDGGALGTKDYAVQAYEAKQFSVTDAAPSIATVNGRIDATVVSGTGAVLLYGTGIANGSQDSIGFEMSFKNAFVSAGVTSVNSFTGAVMITGGTGINVSSAIGNQIVIAATGASSGLTLPYAGSASTASGSGAFAVSNSGTASNVSAVVGSISSSGPGPYSAGLRGTNAGTSGNGIGVWGTHLGGGWGVYGEAVSGRGVFGTSASGPGVYGNSSTDVGAYGISSTVGVKGQQGSPTGFTVPANKLGVWGDSVDGYGVFGSSNNGTGITGVGATRYGVQAIGYATGEPGAALAAFGLASTGPYAAYLSGAVHVTGSLQKGGGSFKIDHPLDPESKYLYHSFVESPDMMNIYNGIAVLDSKGEASVSLPPWFSALNRDFRYQLTCVGGYAPVYVSREVENDSFQIGGGKPGLKVSWQLTGIRQDAWANANRIPVEELKGAAEKGHYLHPQAFGQPEEKGEDWARNPELMKELKQQRERLSTKTQ